MWHAQYFFLQTIRYLFSCFIYELNYVVKEWDWIAAITLILIQLSYANDNDDNNSSFVHFLLSIIIYCLFIECIKRMHDHEYKIICRNRTGKTESASKTSNRIIIIHRHINRLLSSHFLFDRFFFFFFLYFFFFISYLVAILFWCKLTFNIVLSFEYVVHALLSRNLHLFVLLLLFSSVSISGRTLEYTFKKKNKECLWLRKQIKKKLHL